VEDEQPPAIDFRVALAGSTLPVERLTVRTAAPQGVDIDNREGAIALLGYDDPDRVAVVVHEVVAAEELVPTSLPTLAIKTALGKHPCLRIMGIAIGRPRPNHVGMKELDESLRILPIPRRRLPIDHLLDFTLGCHATLSSTPGPTQHQDNLGSSSACAGFVRFILLLASSAGYSNVSALGCLQRLHRGTS
jgi:hypothetical protein